MKRKPISLDPAAFADAAVPQPDPVAAAVAARNGAAEKAAPRRARDASAKASATKQASREGKVQVQVWVEEDVRRKLKTLAINSNTTVEHLLTGAIDQIFRKARI